MVLLGSGMSMLRMERLLVCCLFRLAAALLRGDLGPRLRRPCAALYISAADHLHKSSVAHAPACRLIVSFWQAIVHVCCDPNP